MQPIKFDLNAVGHLAERQRQLVKDVSQITSSVYSMTYRIDYRILARRNIRYRTSNAEMNLRQLEQRMMKLHELMLSAVRLYEDTEKKLERKAEEIAGNKQKSWLVRLFDAIGEFDLRKTLDAISRWLDSEDGRPVKEYLLSLEQVQDTSSDAQLPQLDTTNYKKLTGYYEWVTTGKSRTLYYTDAYGFRETIDINQVINLVQEYNLATGNNYFSGDIIMMMPIDFTDLFAYAIQRGYDPRTFKPIDTNDMEAIHLYIAARKLGEEISRLKARTRESLALDLVPFIGTGKSIIELYQGKNLLTGEELDGWDYAFGAAGTVLPLLKAGRRLFKIFKGADNIEEAVDAGKIADDVGKKIGGTGKLKFKKISETSAENVNKWWKEEMNYSEPPYKPGTFVQEIELTEKSTFVRVYDGENSGMYGGGLMKADDIRGLTPSQIQDKFALPTTPKFILDVELDAGTRIRTGTANPLFGSQGGGQQFDLMGQRVGNFTNPRPLR
jgi:hypothetical protein